MGASSDAGIKPAPTPSPLRGLGGGERPSIDETRMTTLREQMVKVQLEGRDVIDPAVLRVMRKVKRHLFVPPSQAPEAYEDYPLPIGEGQTISQPYIVGLMTQSMGLRGGDRVLEIGTGSGYQAAVLAELAAEVFTIEIIPALGKSAEERLKRLDYKNVHVKIGDGYRGWPEHAPFDAVMVTAAADEIPVPLVEQLKPGGRLVIPVGPPALSQDLIIGTKTAEGTLEKRSVRPVRFVPLIRTH
ncbi:MAG: protein-L-isoaspartate(D-aspartate) O-methyltransferase [Nitrospirae bacterium]|nr:protein-L-isoaspartate(D-aspartate) O-methyltransferase [Nitrospirota bacterium]